MAGQLYQGNLPLMLTLNFFKGIFLHREFVDFRKSINGLGSIVQDEMELNPFEKFLFVFTNKRKNKIKLLYWDRTGFALWYKRLEKGQFKWPTKISDKILEIDEQKMTWLLDGIDILKIKPHEEIFYEKFN